MKLDVVSVWKNVSHRDSLGSEVKPVEAIELSDEELAGVVGAGGHDGKKKKHHHHHRRHHHFFFEKKGQFCYDQSQQYGQYGQYGQHDQYGRHSSWSGY